MDLLCRCSCPQIFFIMTLHIRCFLQDCSDTRAIKTMHGLIYHNGFGFLHSDPTFKLVFWSQPTCSLQLQDHQGSYYGADFGFRLWGHLCCRQNVLRGRTAEICSRGKNISPFRSWDFGHGMSICSQKCITSLIIFKAHFNKEEIVIHLSYTRIYPVSLIKEY